MGILDKLKKTTKRIILTENKFKGKMAETNTEIKYRMGGYEIKRTGIGHDYHAVKRDIFNRKIDEKYIEVKTGNSKLSKRQKSAKKKLGKKYKVERFNGGFLGTPSLFRRPKRKRRKSNWI